MSKVKKFTCRITHIETAETLLVSGKEIERILFSVEGRYRAIPAVSDEGTAYDSLQHDTRFRPATPVEYYMRGDLSLSLKVYLQSKKK